MVRILLFYVWLGSCYLFISPITSRIAVQMILVPSLEGIQ
jgi:hypothetical protein